MHIPDSAGPGRYSGRLTVLADGQKKASLPVEVDVRPVRLEELSDYTIGYYDYVDHYTLPSWSVRERFVSMRAYGMTSVCIIVTDAPRIGVDDQGKPEVDLAGSSLVRGLEAYNEAGFPAPPTILLHGFIKSSCFRLADARSVRHAEIFLSVMKALKAECDRQGWPLPVLSPQDEAPGKRETHHHAALQLRLMKQAGFFTMLNHFLAYPNEAWQAACLPYLDVITLAYNLQADHRGQPPWADCASLANEYGKSLWTYNTLQPGSVQPTSWRFMTGWFFRTWGKDCTGELFFTWDYPTTDPYEDLTPREVGAYGENLRAWYRRDPQRGMLGGPSIDLACAREGVDDLRYIVTLERLISRARSDDRPSVLQVAKKAKDVFEGIKESFDFSHAPHVTIGGTATGAWQFNEERGGALVASGEYLYSNGWGPADYDAAREKIVSQIIRLQETLRKP